MQDSKMKSLANLKYIFRIGRDYNPKLVKFILYLFNRQLSNFYIILGRRGTGKTDFSFLICAILYFNGLITRIATNVKIHNSPFHIEHIDNLEDLTLWCQSSTARKLFIFDEAGRSMARRSPMAKLNVQIIKELQIIRKYKLSLLFVTPHEKYIDGATLGSDVLDGYFVKTDLGKKNALYVDLLEGGNIPLHGIPRTLVHFDTWDSADFTLKPLITKAMFSNEEHKILWRYAHGETYTDLNVHPEKFRRIIRKFIRETLKPNFTVHKTLSEG